MLGKEKAQVSIEFILITGAFLFMAVMIMPYILREFELSKAVAAARDGAEFALSMRGMGYDTPTGNITNIPEGAIKMKNMSLEDSGSVPNTCNISGKKWYRIKFYMYVPSYIYSNSTYWQSIGTTVRHYARGNLHRAFWGSYDPALEGVETERYCFTIGADFIPY